MKLAFSLGLIAGIDILVAFLIQWYVLITIGPGIETDALFAGMAVPQLVFAVISGSLMHVLVPMLATKEKKHFHQNAWGFFIIVGGVFSAIAGLLSVLAPYWVPLFVPGFSDDGKSLTVILTRIQLLGMVFTGLLGVLWSAYHARQRFIWVELSTVIGTTIGMGVLIWALPRYGILAAAWVAVVRVVLPTMLLLPGLGAFYKPDWSNVALREAWRKIKPLLIGRTYYKTDTLVDRFLSSMASAGGLSLLYFGQQLYGAASQIMNKAVAAPMVPVLACHSEDTKWRDFRSVYRNRLLFVSVIGGGGYLIILLFGESLLNLLIGYGAVTKENVRLLWWILVALGGVFLGGSMGQITSVSFYAMGDTKTPTKLGIWTYTIFIPLKIISFLYYGLIGLAITTSIFFAVNFALQFYLLERLMLQSLIKLK